MEYKRPHEMTDDELVDEHKATALNWLDIDAGDEIPEGEDMAAAEEYLYDRLHDLTEEVALRGLRGVAKKRETIGPYDSPEGQLAGLNNNFAEAERAISDLNK